MCRQISSVVLWFVWNCAWLIYVYKTRQVCCSFRIVYISPKNMPKINLFKRLYLLHSFSNKYSSYFNKLNACGAWVITSKKVKNIRIVLPGTLESGMKIVNMLSWYVVLEIVTTLVQIIAMYDTSSLQISLPALWYLFCTR